MAQSNIVFRIHKCSHHIALLSWSGVSFWSNLPFWDLPWKGWELSYKFITTAVVVVAVVGDANPYQTEATSAEFFSCGFLQHTYIFVAESLVDEVSWLTSSSPEAVSFWSGATTGDDNTTNSVTAFCHVRKSDCEQFLSLPSTLEEHEIERRAVPSLFLCLVCIIYFEFCAWRISGTKTDYG